MFGTGPFAKMPVSAAAFMRSDDTRFVIPSLAGLQDLTRYILDCLIRLVKLYRTSALVLIPQISSSCGLLLSYQISSLPENPVNMVLLSYVSSFIPFVLRY